MSGTPKQDTLSRLGFPELWRTSTLYPENLRTAQEALLLYEQPGAVCGAEHYRYGAFCFWTKDSKTSQGQIHDLIAAASADPDHAMAQCALLDLVAHPNCTEKLYAEAIAVFEAFPEQYYEMEQYVEAHRDRRPSWQR